jgi:hypothetical protein
MPVALSWGGAEATVTRIALNLFDYLGPLHRFSLVQDCQAVPGIYPIR